MSLGKCLRWSLNFKKFYQCDQKYYVWVSPRWQHDCLLIFVGFLQHLQSLVIQCTALRWTLSTPHWKFLLFGSYIADAYSFYVSYIGFITSQFYMSETRSMALRCRSFSEKNIEIKHLLHHDKNYYYFLKSNFL